MIPTPTRRRSPCALPSLLFTLLLAAQALMIAAVTAWASRRTLFATLREID